MLIQSGLGSPPMALGGYLAELPKGYIAETNGPAYTYQFITDRPKPTLRGATGMAEACIQIDCFGPDGPSVISLARAINQKLHGFVGTLPDVDSTFVSCCFRSDAMDFPFDQYARNFRRMLEFELLYANTF
jgi:hypothetical protein